MLAQRMFSLLVVAVAMSSAGCTVETADSQVDQSFDVALDTMGGIGDPQDSPPGSGNGFLPACFWEPNVIPGFRKYAVQRLWNSPAGSTYGTLPPNSTMNLVPSACRAEALKYLARCALPKDTFMIDPLTGARYWGWLNLSPTWRTGALPPDDQWWMTACLLQHLNGFDAEVPILLDGAGKPPLLSPAASHPIFIKKDSRAWGNLFYGTDQFTANVCYENDLISSCSETTVVDTRICDTDPSINCNLNIVGPCHVACTFSMSLGGYLCGSSGAKNIGSRLKDFTMYGTMCPP
jgi:hypothetical protein